MNKTNILLTVASLVLSLSNVVCGIQILSDNDDILDEDTVVNVKITNDRALETLDPADRSVIV